MNIGNHKTSNNIEVKGKMVNIGNEKYYKISNVNEMRPFFMSIVSPSNHWMFLSSNGGLSAGRKNSDVALFPYYTDDKITEAAETTGSKTIIQVSINGKLILWEPFSQRYFGHFNIKRNLYKNNYGNKIIFEEINTDLELTFQYQWCSSNQFGFVKKSTITNNSNKPQQVKVLDGLQNIMPYGVSADLQNASSNLVDAYKKCELESAFGLGIYALSAIIVDKAEPSEALKANIAWSYGLKNPIYLLSSKQLNNFRRGQKIEQETDIKAEKGAYFICTDLTLSQKVATSWYTIAEVNQTIVKIKELTSKIKNEKNLDTAIEKDIKNGTKELIELVGNADGQQITADKLSNTRHFSNTLFNIMRGGIFDDNYNIEKFDFIKYLSKANKQVFKNKFELVNNLPEIFSLNDLKNVAKNDPDANFKRLAFEYLPLKFSRRHGDPSRPWNKFSINTKSEIDGSKILDYEGNWRDIFQNWEALAHSYPAFIEGMIHKFLNASTFDGYNPYRVTKDGFDWETIEPDNPWSYIGYWGDHQIIYLLKFLEFIENHYPNKLASYFNQDLFVYANVPYKIKPYQEIVKNSKDTIEFDTLLDELLVERKKTLGADGALIQNNTQLIHHVNLIEKLLATVLAKVSNFIPEAGIWMNTQRPEWNDANNALVGNGVSMVTLYYLRRFLLFFEKIITNSSKESFQISEKLVQLFNEITTTLNTNKNLLSGSISDKDRKKITDKLGAAASNYRFDIYKNGFSHNKNTISKNALLSFTSVSIQFINHSIKANERVDNLYHAYNLITIKNDQEISISHLPEMLEGQVAVLSSGYLSGKDSLQLLNALKNSALFRHDQYSYILYPNKTLPRFVDKNNIPKESIENCELFQQLLSNGNTQIIEKDADGNYHFNGNFNNVGSLKAALSQLPKTYNNIVKGCLNQALDTFELVFNHKSFTGRSGTFFGYEGLGSIYWHMVSKLLLSVQETCLHAVENNENEVLIGKLLEHYYEINEGIGVHKSPKLYGAFPTDPYSHTPEGKGVQQPGMTGQVKEDILSRFGELGVFVENGVLKFNPRLLRKEEFLKKSTEFNFTNINKKQEQLNLPKDALCFTFCQIPIIYRLSNSHGINVFFKNDTVIKFDSLVTNQQISSAIFNRTGDISHIIVTVVK